MDRRPREPGGVRKAIAATIGHPRGRGESLLYSPWVGETEQQIAAAFAEARDARAFLIFDEADSLLGGRESAHRSWEVSRVNEMLTWMESHPLPFACTTNFGKHLDPGTLRRFVFKVRLDYLAPGQVEEAFPAWFAPPQPDGLTDLAALTAAKWRQCPQSGAFNQTGVLDGVLIRIGGRDDTVAAHLRDGDTIHPCNATREMARRLAVHLYGPPLRVHGNGRRERDADGGWVMKRFNITSFDELDDAPLGEVAQRLRDVEGNGWKEIEDPTAGLRHLRGVEEAH